MNDKQQQQGYGLDEAIEDATHDLGALGALRRAELTYQAQHAREHKRRMVEVMRELEELACASQEVAESCYYSVPRSGEPLQGPSIRFAELLSFCMPNTEVTTEFITVNNDEAVSRGRFVDSERNRVVQADARRPVYKKKWKSEPDQDDMKIAYEVASALAFRNVMFKAVPRALWDPVYRKVMRVADGEKSIDDRRRLCLEFFRSKGATDEQVLAALGREESAEITIKDIRHLKGMAGAMRDGVLSLDEALRPREKGGDVKVTARSLADRMKPKPEPAPAPDRVTTVVEETSPHDPETGEVVEPEFEAEHDYHPAPPTADA